MSLHRAASASRQVSRRKGRAVSARHRPAYRALVQATELRETLELAPLSAITPSLVGAMLVAGFWTHPARDVIVVAAIVISLACLVGMIAARRTLRPVLADLAVARMRGRAVILASLIGTTWATIPVVLFADSDPRQRLVLLGGLATTVAGVFLTGPLLAVRVAFLIPLLAGTALGIARSGGVDAAPLLGAIAAVTLILALTLKRAHRQAKRRIIDGFLVDELDQTVETLLLDIDEQNSDWTFDLDAARRLRNVSTAMALAAGRPAESLEGTRFVSLFEGSKHVRSAIADRRPFREEILQIVGADRPLWWRVTAKPVYERTGAFLGYRGIGSDITDARTAEARAHHLASFDPLTGLANREQFMALVTRECAAAARDGHWRALLYLDLDGFKNANDGFGHAAGDAVLKAVAQRLESRVDGALLARLGGDEFAIWMTAGTPARAETLAISLIDVLATPFDVQGAPVSISASVGIAFAPKHGLGTDQLLGRADLALYRAKADGKGTYRIFIEDYELSLIEQRKLRDDLRLALALREFELHYQPLVDLSHGTIVGFEALIRWHSPTRGFVSPAEFIPAAEKSGQIGAIGRWVLMQACKDAAAWPAHTAIAVNVSPQQVRSVDFVQTVLVALQTSGLPPTRLEIEVTESVFLDDSPLALANLSALRERGIRIALDDFGTGYSSLSYLINFRVDKIKIDRSFVRDCATRHENQTVVDAILTIARELSIHVTAEGVETVDQALALKLRRCDDVQGYLFSKPRPRANVPAMFEEIPARFHAIFPLGFDSPLGLSLAMKRQSA